MRLIISLLLLFMMGCPPPALSPAYLYEDAGSLLRHHGGVQQRLQAIQAEARVDQRGDKGRVRGTVMMFVVREGRVRFDVMTQFGPILTLTSDGEQFGLSDMRERTFTHGPACEANIARLLGMPVSARQAAALLLGGAPDVDGARDDLEWRPGSGSYRVVRRAGDLIAELELSLLPEDEKAALDKQRLRLTRTSLRNVNGHVFWTAEYSDYRSVSASGGHSFDMPFRVRVMQPSTETDTVVRFQEIEPNPDIPDGAFTQRAPAGVTTVESPCDR